MCGARERRAKFREFQFAKRMEALSSLLPSSTPRSDARKLSWADHKSDAAPRTISKGHGQDAASPSSSFKKERKLSWADSSPAPRTISKAKPSPAEEGVGTFMGLNESIHYTFQHLDHRRRMKAHAAYAEYLVSGSTTSDLVARLVATVYALIAAATAATISHAAGYTLFSGLTLIIASAIAVVAAMWPPEATTLAVKPGGPPPRWVKFARRWLAKARKRLPERKDAAATKIAARYRGDVQERSTERKSATR